MTLEQLFAFTEPGYEGANGIGVGADAWERVVGSTVKRVDGEAQGKESKVRIMTLLLLRKENVSERKEPGHLMAKMM